MINEHTRQALGWNGEKIHAGVDGVGAMSTAVK